MIELKISINDTAIYGVSKHHVIKGIKKGFKKWEDVCGVKFTFLFKQPAHYHIGTDIIPLNDGSQARGIAAGIPSQRFWLNSGYQAPGKEYGELWYPFGDKNNIDTEERIGKVVAHEWGHCIGLDHDEDRSCIMNINASSDSLCQHEINYAVSRYGPHTDDEPKDADEPTIDKDETLEIKRGNIVVVEKGSLVMENGERIYLGGGGNVRWNGGTITFIQKAGASGKLAKEGCCICHK